MELKNLIFSLSEIMSISGCERYGSEKLEALIGKVFDESYTDKIGNHIFIKRCGRENAPKILVECHFDEIGMVVTGIKKGGFLTVAQVGGVDTRLLPSSEVVIYGKETIRGIFASDPTYLRDAENANKLKTMDKLVIDTGYSEEELREICPVGTPVGYKPEYRELLNGRLIGKAFDDKACGACAVCGIEAVDKYDMAGDVYFAFATREEVGGMGAMTASYGIDPDYCLVMDVTHAWIPEMTTMKWAGVGSGVAFAVSAVTNRRLTKMSAGICDKKKIKYTLQAEPGNTGTDANAVGTSRGGIPTVLASLPLKNMHTANELLGIEDAEALSAFASEFIRSKEIAEVFAR